MGERKRKTKKGDLLKEEDDERRKRDSFSLSKKGENNKKPESKGIISTRQ